MDLKGLRYLEVFMHISSAYIIIGLMTLLPTKKELIV
jgi:hypothetical protein